MNKRSTCAPVLGFLALPVLAMSVLAVPVLARAQAEPAPMTAIPSRQAPTQVPAQAQAQEQEQVQEQGRAPADAVAAQVVVSGKRPGPGLWKVSKGEHVMWVFGLYSPLPQKMAWDAGRVERLVAQSQEVLAPPRAALGTSSFFGTLGALPAMIGMMKNPDGATLHDLLPTDVYARWQALKGKYIGDDDGIERYRPLFASSELMDAGMKKNGLARGVEVSKQIEKIARKNDVKVVDTGFTVNIDNLGQALREFKKSQLEDVACFTKTLERFEGDIDAMRARANAWANGNIAEINNVNYAEREDACNDALMNSAFARNNPAMQNMRERRQVAWLKAAEAALDKNATTFAMLSMSEILGPKSYLAVLQARGYTVESPK
jgi:hypothetical protein